MANKDYSEVNAYMAEKCGVVMPLINGKNDCWWKIGESITHSEWTILDPRCREIIRENFRLTTDLFGETWACFQRENVDFATATRGNGKTIAEAEIACIVTIWEKDNE